MINFNPKTAAVFRTLWWGRRLIFKRAGFFKFLFLVFSFCFFAVFLLGLWQYGFRDFVLKKLIGAGIIFLCFFLCFFELDAFFNLKLKKPKLKFSLTEAIGSQKDFNLADFFDYELARIIRQCLRFQKRNKLQFLTSRVLLYFVLKSKNKEISFLTGRAGLSAKAIIRTLEQSFSKSEFGERDSFEKTMLAAADFCWRAQKARIEPGDVMAGLAGNDKFFQRILLELDLTDKDIERLKDWFERIWQELQEQRKFWLPVNLLKKGSVGRHWAAGFSITLDRYSTDIKERIKKGGFSKIVGHGAELSQIERILSRDTLNNVLLVGEPGTGRRSIILALAQKTFLGKSLAPINYKRILELDIGYLLSQVSSQEELEIVLENCFQEAVSAGNIILVIDNLQNFIKESAGPGQIDISGILSRYLELPNLQLICLTTFDGLHRILERKSEICNLFAKVEVLEISEEETLELLENFVPFFEKKYKKFISFQGLREIVRLSSLYLPNVPFPKKAMDTLNEVMVYLIQGTRENVLNSSHVAKVVSERTKIPIGEVAEREREILLNLENLIHQRVINQEEGVRELAAALRRTRSGVRTRKGPVGGFLFLGPTGVGKTETAKALSQFYFGSEQKMIRLDMSEFQNLSDIERLLGSQEIEVGVLTTAVRENPFSLLLLDEIEKAHPNILNLFLQVLDEGWLTDGFGRRVSFQQTIIIGTSNAGTEIIRQDIAKDKKLDLVRENLLDYLLRQGIFRPEFINRFDGVVVFKPLTKENLLAIAQLMLEGLRKNLKEKGIEFELGEGLKEKIAAISYSPEFGAREMRRVIQNKVENLLAEAILSNKIKKGDKIKVGQDFNLEILF